MSQNSTDLPNLDYTEPMHVYSYTGKIMVGMLNGTIDWEAGNDLRNRIFKRAQEEQMKNWNI